MKAIDAKHYLLSARVDENRVKGAESFPFSLPLIRNLGEIEFSEQVTFIIGENGAGKSTLLEALAIAWGLNPEGGSKNYRFASNDTHSNFHEALTITRGVARPKDEYFLRAETFYNLATYVDELGTGDARFQQTHGGTSFHQQSHGESFLSLLLHRFRGNGLYLLDEPEAALSPQRQLSALVRMHQLVAMNSQFIIATHSPILMAYPWAKILLATEAGLEEVAYKDTEHYSVTKAFLNDPARMLAALFLNE